MCRRNNTKGPSRFFLEKPHLKAGCMIIFRRLDNALLKVEIMIVSRFSLSLKKSNWLSSSLLHIHSRLRFRSSFLHFYWVNLLCKHCQFMEFLLFFSPFASNVRVQLNKVLSLLSSHMQPKNTSIWSTFSSIIAKLAEHLPIMIFTSVKQMKSACAATVYTPLVIPVKRLLWFTGFDATNIMRGACHNLVNQSCCLRL